jgi:hypothetical protein
MIFLGGKMDITTTDIGLTGTITGSFPVIGTSGDTLSTGIGFYDKITGSNIDYPSNGYISTPINQEISVLNSRIETLTDTIKTLMELIKSMENRLKDMETQVFDLD